MKDALDLVCRGVFRYPWDRFSSSFDPRGVSLLSDITLVTAFFDLGRSAWTPKEGFPAIYERATSVYFERFETLASLRNALVVYTSPDLVPEVEKRCAARQAPTKIVPFSFSAMFAERRAAIRRIQQNACFLERINPLQRKNAERRCPDYILLLNLKPFFVMQAVQKGYVRDSQAAWIDFGYFRTPDALCGSDHWQHAFAPGKIHMFAFSPYRGEIALNDIVANNIAYIVGGCVVAAPEMWAVLTALVDHAAQELAARTMVDNDQTLFLMASLYRPDLFDIHLVAPEGWWDPFRFFNDNVSLPDLNA